MKRPAALRALVALLVFQGLSAVPPGLMLVVDPTGGLMRMPVQMLTGSIFPDFLVPGLFLAGVLGLGAFGVAVALLRRWPWSGWAAQAFGATLMAWILVQVAVIGAGSWLQPLYFGLGLLVLLLARTPSVRAHLQEAP